VAHMHDRSVWSSGGLRENKASIHKSMTTSLRNFHAELFPKLQKEVESVEKDTEAEESEESASCALPPVKAPEGVTGADVAALERALEKCGYSKDLLGDEKFSSILSKAFAEKAEVITHRTGKMWIERAIPEEPPAFVRPDSVKVGDQVQVLNWVPLGVHGAKIDLFPKGKVSKIYKAKCLVTKEPIPFGVIPGDDAEFIEEERVLGLELDGKGPYVQKSGSSPFPYITKDSTLIVRFPVMATPSGQTEHNSPGIM
jgi:hypothetical protein